MEYLEYIKNRVEDIRNVHYSYDVLSNYSKVEVEQIKSIAKTNSSLRLAVNLLEKKKRIDRSFVFNQFKYEPLSVAFWVAMLWGHIWLSNLKRAAGDKSLEDKLKDVRDLLKKSDLKTAFLSMKGEYKGHNNKIPGINTSFLTKVLYFMKDSYPQPIKPLIYDRWSMAIDAALLYSGVRPKDDNYTLLFTLRGGFKAPEGPKSVDELTMYQHYLLRMETLGKRSDLNVSSENLEEYLFGTSQRQKLLWNDNNPRFYLQERFLRPLCRNRVTKHIKGQRVVFYSNIQATTAPENNGDKAKASVERELRLDEFRHSLRGYLINRGYERFKLFVGRDKMKAYCEIYPASVVLDKETLLLDRHFLIKGGKGQKYYVRYFSIADINSAIQLMIDIKEILLANE